MVCIARCRTEREETGVIPVTDKARRCSMRSRREVVNWGGASSGASSQALIAGTNQQAGAETLPRFVIRHQHGETLARRVIPHRRVSLPRTGSDGAGYGLKRGISTITSHQPFRHWWPRCWTNAVFMRHLCGLSQEVEIQTLVEGRPVDRRIGSLL